MIGGYCDKGDQGCDVPVGLVVVMVMDVMCLLMAVIVIRLIRDVMCLLIGGCHGDGCDVPVDGSDCDKVDQECHVPVDWWLSW